MGSACHKSTVEPVQSVANVRMVRVAPCNGNPLNSLSTEDRNEPLINDIITAKWPGGGRFGVAWTQKSIITVGGNAIEIFDMEGTLLKQIHCSELLNSFSLTTTNNELYVSNMAKDKREILVLSMEGKVKRKLCLPPYEKIVNEYLALGVAKDPENGNLFISSSGTNFIYKVEKGSKEVVPLIVEGLTHPCYLCVTCKHEIVVANHEGHCVQKYSPGGKLLWSFGSFGTGLGQFNKPHGICADSLGQIYVADYGNNRIYLLSPEGTFVRFIETKVTLIHPQAIAIKHEWLVVTCGNTMTSNSMVLVKMGL